MESFIGIDVSKHQLDVDWLNKPVSFDNNELGIAKLAKKLTSLQNLKLVVCEASGGYEQKMVLACHKAQLPVHVAHANKIRNFAKSKGLKAKTDKLDSRVLTEYGVKMQPQADCLLLSENAVKIKELLKRREQLQNDRKREKNRLDKIDRTVIKNSINNHIEWLDKSIKKIDEQLSKLSQSDELSKDYSLLTSIPGVGGISAYYLLAFLPEVGKLSNKAISSLVGVAPFNRDSGKYQGQRYIQGGRRELRQTLYMAALTSTKWNKDLGAFYQRLRKVGKPFKVAIVAVLRKLLTVINSVMKRQEKWTEKMPNFA